MIVFVTRSFLLLTALHADAYSVKVSRSGQFRSLAEVAPGDDDESASAAHGHFIRHLPKVVEADDFRATPVNRDIKPADRLYIAVMSAPRNIARRTAVRTTWKKDADRKPHMFTVKFVVCIRGIEKGYYRRLQREIELYNDIEMLDCYEGYDGGNLTRKVFAAMQRFDEENEMRALAGNETAFMKTDDDTLVRVGPLMEVIKSTSSRSQNYYIGMYAGEGRKPNRNPKLPWYEPHRVWPRKYKAAMAGAGYVLNAGLVHRWCTDDRAMVAARTLWSEDQAVGTWVDHEVETNKIPVQFVKLCGVDATGHPLDRGNYLTHSYRGDRPQNELVIFHKMDPPTMDCVWRALQSGVHFTACLPEAKPEATPSKQQKHLKS